MVRGSRWVKAAALAAAMLGGASTATAQSVETDLTNVISVVKNQVVTGSGAHHVLMWPSELEGYVDRENGEKVDFAITMGNYLPSDLGTADVNVQIGKGLRERDTGAGAIVGIRTPAGTLAIDTAGTAHAQGTIGVTDAALAQYAAFPKILDQDKLDDLRFLADRCGLHAGGNGSSSARAFDHTDGRGWDVYKLRTEIGPNGSDITVALNPARTLADFAFTASHGTVPIEFGKRSMSDRDQLLDTIVRNANGTYSPQSRTNVDLTASACIPDAITACIQQNRFEIRTTWQDFQGNSGTGLATKLGADSADFSFFNPANNELIIKVLDGTSLSGAYWVFWKALSNVAYTLTIRDTLTNQTLTYINPSGYISGGHLDVNTIFRPDGTGAASRTFNTQTDLPPNGIPDIYEYTDPSLIGPCIDSEYAKCFGGKFLVSGTWENFTGGSGLARVIKKSDLSGYFTFFDPVGSPASNFEVLFKILDGRPLTPNYWVFVAGLTNVDATFTAIDKTTGKVYEQHNPAGTSFATNLDVNTILTASAQGMLAGESMIASGGILAELSAPPDSTLEQALETIHDRMTVVTQPDGSFATVPQGLVVARPDFAGRIGGAELYGVRSQWGPNGFGSAGGGFLKYSREAVVGATLRVLPSDAGVGYALMIDDNVSTLNPTTAHENVRVTFDGKTVSNEAGGVRYATGFTTDATLMSALKTLYNGGTASPQQVQSLMLIPHTTRTMACESEGMSNDCDEYSGATVSLQQGSTEDLQISGRFKGNAYLDLRQDERLAGGALDQRWWYEDGHSSLSVAANITTRPASVDYGRFTNGTGYFTLKVIGEPDGGRLFPETGVNAETYDHILSAAPADWRFPLLPFE